MKRFLYGALLLALYVAQTSAHGHMDDDDEKMKKEAEMMDHSHLQALMPSVNSIDEILNTWSRKRKEAFVSSWENSEHDCAEGGDRDDHHCDNHENYIRDLIVKLAKMSEDELNEKVKEIYGEMVKHAQMAATSMGNSFKAMVGNEKFSQMVKDVAAKNGMSGADHEHDIMKNLLKDHIEGNVNDHLHGIKLNYTKIYNSLPETLKYKTTGQTPVAKAHLTKFLDVINDDQYSKLKQKSASILQEAAADMKRHALRYNRFATAFEAHKHK